MILTVLVHGYFCGYMVMKVFQRGDDSNEGVLLALIDVLEARWAAFNVFLSS